MKRALITGITGQDGSFLAELLLSKGYEVFGLYRRAAAPNFSNIEHIKDQVKLVCGDLTDPTSINEVISSLHFDEVYNLAAQSFVKASFDQPHLTFEIDTIGVLNLLEAIRRFSPKTRFYQASTSEMFGSNYSSYRGMLYQTGGEIVNGKYQDEKTPFQPESPYAVAKVAAHQLCQLYRKAYGLHISCGILFNHESERRGLEFVTRKITSYCGKFAEWSIRNGADYTRLDYSDPKIMKLPNDYFPALEYPKLALGNLDASRDWGYAKDFVEGMWLMLQQETPDDYVLCTGETHTIREFLQECFVGDYMNYVYQDPQFMRPSEVPYLKGSYSKAKEKLGWAPKTSFKELVNIMLERDLGQWFKKS